MQKKTDLGHWIDCERSHTYWDDISADKTIEDMLFFKHFIIDCLQK